MSEQSDLYQQVILDHNRAPRNFRALEADARRADGHNPLCGDRLTVYVEIEDGRVSRVGFTGSGCAISKASASMMTEAIRGRTEAEVRALFEAFHGLVTGDGSVRDDDPRLGKLIVFGGVRDYPVRVKCATLAWHTLKAALEHPGGTATTE